MPTIVPTVAFSDERLANGLRVIVAEDHLAPVVAINLWYDVGSKHEEPGKTGFAHLFEHVMFQGIRARRQGRAHRPRPGRRRDDERHDLARPDELLRDAARRTSWTSALWLEADRMAHAASRRSARRTSTTSARSSRTRSAGRTTTARTARGRRSSRATCSRRSTRTTTRRSARWRTSTRPRSRTSAPSSGPTTRRTTRSCRSSATSTRPRSRASAERYFGGIPANPSIPPLGDLSLPPTLGGERRETVHDRVPLPRVYVGFRAPGLRRPAARRPRRGRPDPGRRQGQPAPSPPGPRRADRPGRRPVHARVRRRRVDLSPAGRPSARASTVERVEAAFHEELERLARRAGQRRRAGPGLRARSRPTSWARSSGSRSGPTGCRCTRRCSTTRASSTGCCRATWR